MFCRPPGSRTPTCLIKSQLLCRLSQLATSESNRAIPPYQSGPYDRMGRGQREEDGGVEPHGVTRREGSSPAAAPAAHLPRAESGGHDPQRQDADPHSKRSRSLIGSLSLSTVPGIRTPITRDLSAVPLPLG